ncbi:hypothetical protein [Pseudomonas sp. N040]|uniref:hypothetical protein n=1 Tax=Pseudomonas sp. N040 TaxID=2785325 RepID=UPI0018A30CCB|nr:hypothetical protein [Pseudomonas sp. N040]MBF7730926.1 hypothetical protein [Pseudomonas sp. N040]MBW7014569.1 hypothetical protein [Pseudomonas sp. N040]
MQYSTALSDAILALACLACLLQPGLRQVLGAAGAGPRRFCIQLGFALPAAAAAVGAVRFGLTADARELHGWLSRASSFLGLPLLGLAALSLSRGWDWQGPAWGRLLLGLCAGFELFRQLGWSDEYRLLLQLGSLLLILYAGLSQWPWRRPALLALGVTSLFIVAGLLVGTEGFAGPFRRVDLFHALLTPAYPLLAWLLGGLAAGKSPAKPL